jgi:hypothetical protein
MRTAVSHFIETFDGELHRGVTIEYIAIAHSSALFSMLLRKGAALWNVWRLAECYSFAFVTPKARKELGMAHMDLAFQIVAQ